MQITVETPKSAVISASFLSCWLVVIFYNASVIQSHVFTGHSKRHNYVLIFCIEWLIISLWFFLYQKSILVACRQKKRWLAVFLSLYFPVLQDVNTKGPHISPSYNISAKLKLPLFCWIHAFGVCYWIPFKRGNNTTQLLSWSYGSL
jgi:hypothetical protein